MIGFDWSSFFIGKSFLSISFKFLFRLLAASSSYFRLFIWMDKTFSAKFFKIPKLLKYFELGKLSLMCWLRYPEVIFTTYDKFHWRKGTFSYAIFKYGYSLKHFNKSHQHHCISFGILFLAYWDYFYFDCNLLYFYDKVLYFYDKVFQRHMCFLKRFLNVIVGKIFQQKFEKPED